MTRASSTAAPYTVHNRPLPALTSTSGPEIDDASRLRTTCAQIKPVNRSAATFDSCAAHDGRDGGQRRRVVAQQNEVGDEPRAEFPFSWRRQAQPRGVGRANVDHQPPHRDALDDVGAAQPVRKSNVRVNKPKTPRARTPSTLVLRRGCQNNK